MFRVVARAIFGAVLAAGIALPAAACASPAEDSMLARIDQVRLDRGLEPLRTSPLLSDSAASYSRYMLARDYFGHLSAVRASNKFTMKGEILAWHTGSEPRVTETLRSWMASPTHRAVILHPKLRYVGAGMERGTLSGRNVTLWTVQFGRL